MPSPAIDGAEVLGDIRRARRRRRMAEFDPFDALYRAYLVVILGGIALWFGSGLVGDTRVKASGVHQVLTQGPAVIGVVVGLIFAVGLRSGARGGPLALEAADVRHVLMAPIERRRALGPPALRQARFGALVGATVGAVAGLLAFRRLPGPAPEWLASGALCGVAVALGSIGAAMAVSGRQLRGWMGEGLAVVAVGWPLLDLGLGSEWSPFSLLGEVALWPLRWRPAGLISVVLCAVVIVGGLCSVGGTSIEASERRSSLVGQLRFAATLRDLRTVMVLRRQLAQELPRRRPWFRLGRPRVAGRWVVWRRGWHGISRFPARRLFRLGLLGALGGVAALGAARGTTPLVAVSGLAFYVAALDAFEPLSQEIDHPDRRDGVPVDAGRLMVGHLVAPMCVTLGVAACGWVAAVATTAALAGPVATVTLAGAVALVPAGLGGAAGGAISVVQGAPTTFSTGNLVLAPEVAGLRALFPVVWPPVVAIIGVLPVLAAGHRGPSGAAGVVGALTPLVVVLALLVASWVRWREAVHAWFRDLMRGVDPSSG